MILRFAFLVFALTFSLGLAQAQTPIQAKPRIAIWNPETITQSSRFHLDLDWLNEVAQWLGESGIETARLTAEQLEDAETFSAAKFDALIFPGDAFPRRNTPVLQRFAAEGGILISLGAGPVPFLIAIEQPPGGNWTPSPVAPDKKWETADIYGKVLGLIPNDVPKRRDDGVRHQATPLFKKYLPTPTTIPSIEKALPSRWLVPRIGTSLYPLIRSQRADGNDTVPQLFIVQNKTSEGTQEGIQSAIVAISNTFTRLNPLAKPTIIAMAKIAADLKSGALQLKTDTKIELRDDEPGEAPAAR